MTPPRAAPPAADPCLSRPYSSSPNCKGGTYIDESVRDLAEHLRKLRSPDEYRLFACRCGCRRLHVHDRRERRPRNLVVNGEPVVVVQILVFACAACSATWRVLPAFLARHLWRSWAAIERALAGKPATGSAGRVPERTVQRWRARLAQSARLPIQVLVVAGGRLRELAERVGLLASRDELVAAYGCGLAALAALLHRLAPGVRLM